MLDMLYEVFIVFDVQETLYGKIEKLNETCLWVEV